MRLPYDIVLDPPGPALASMVAEAFSEVGGQVTARDGRVTISPEQCEASLLQEGAIGTGARIRACILRLAVLAQGNATGTRLRLTRCLDGHIEADVPL